MHSLLGRGATSGPSYWVIAVYMSLYENPNSRRAGALALH